MKNIKKWLIYKIYRLLRPYIIIDKWQATTSLNFYFTIKIFDEPVSEIKFSEYELVPRVNV